MSYIQCFFTATKKPENTALVLSNSKVSYILTIPTHYHWNDHIYERPMYHWGSCISKTSTICLYHVDLFISLSQLQTVMYFQPCALKIKIFQFSAKNDGILQTGFQLLLSNNKGKDKHFPCLALCT